MLSLGLDVGDSSLNRLCRCVKTSQFAGAGRRYKIVFALTSRFFSHLAHFADNTCISLLLRLRNVTITVSVM